MVFKFSLEKGSRKFNCPNCNKRSFVKYINNEDGAYLGDLIGRCDRESKCQYHRKPNAENSILSSFYTISEVTPSCHNANLLFEYGKHYSQNNFITFLKRSFSVNEIEVAVKKYFIGTSSHWQGATIFWQVDEQLNICAGKVMLYDAISGKRMKQPRAYVGWMHKILRIHDFVLQQCLFGIHNLCDYDKTTTTICIVESEKTAIIMSILFPENLWLATGGKSNLKEALLQPVKEYKIIVHPDKTEFETWNKIVERLHKLGFRITCSNLLENKDIEEGDDLVDFLMKVSA